MTVIRIPSFEKIRSFGKSNICILVSNLLNVWMHGMIQKHPKQPNPGAILPSFFVKIPCSNGLWTYFIWQKYCVAFRSKPKINFKRFFHISLWWNYLLRGVVFEFSIDFCFLIAFWFSSNVSCCGNSLRPPLPAAL